MSHIYGYRLAINDLESTAVDMLILGKLEAGQFDPLMTLKKSVRRRQHFHYTYQGIKIIIINYVPFVISFFFSEGRHVNETPQGLSRPRGFITPAIQLAQVQLPHARTKPREAPVYMPENSRAG